MLWKPSALVTPIYRCASTPSIRAPALDGHGKAAPYSGPDDESQTRDNCAHVLALPVHLAPVCHFYHQDCFLGVRNGVNHAVTSLPHSVFILRGKLFTARWPWISCQGGNLPGKASAVLLGNRLKLSGRRGLDQYPIAFHAASSPSAPLQMPGRVHGPGP